MQTAAPGSQGQITGIGSSTPVQLSALTPTTFPLNNGVTVRGMSGNSTNHVFVAVQHAAPAGAVAWVISTNYAVGNLVKNAGCVYVCTQAGQSAGSGGPTGTGAGITDGTAKWDFQSIYAVSATNGYELNASESHLFQVADPSTLYVIGSASSLGVCFDMS